MLQPQSNRHVLQYLMITAAFTGSFDQLAAYLQMRVSTRCIDVIVLKEHGCRQDNVSVLSGFCHELLVHHCKQIITL